MSSNEEKAMALLAEADKKLNSSKGFFSSLFGWVDAVVVGGPSIDVRTMAISICRRVGLGGGDVVCVTRRVTNPFSKGCGFWDPLRCGEGARSSRLSI